MPLVDFSVQSIKRDAIVMFAFWGTNARVSNIAMPVYAKLRVVLQSIECHIGW